MTADGVEIACTAYGHDTSVPVVVFTHGFSSSQNNSTNRTLLPSALEHGLTALTFDFRGCGSSGGRLAETTVTSGTLDLAAALSGLAGLREPSPEAIYVGSSFGATVALAFVTSQEHESRNSPPARGMVFKAPMLRLAEAQRRKRGDATMQKWREQGWLEVDSDKDVRLSYDYISDSLQYDFYSDRITTVLTSQIEIIHGTEDDTAPFEFSEQFAALAPDLRHIAAIEGAGHKFDGRGQQDALTHALIEGLARVL